MRKLVCWIISFCLLLGVGDALVTMTLKMAGLAAYAHQHDQMSYSDFTRSLLNAKPRKHPNSGHPKP